MGMKINRQTHRVLGIAAVALAAGGPWAWADQPNGALQTFNYHEAKVLGTALDLTVVAADQSAADAARGAVLAEIGRLEKILSAYDADSELGRLNASPVNGPLMAVSPELIDVLQQYDDWFKQTDGAYSGHAGDVLALWAAGEKKNELPSDAELLAAAQQCSAPAWEISGGKVRRIAEQTINLDSLGKGYIIDKAVAAATKQPTKIKGLLLNIGGDLRTWGTPAAGGLWAIGVQDPAHPELNATPLTTIYVAGNTSVSSSGSYQRFYTIGGKHYSHIIDARTGKPGKNAAATVVAADSATANALATICCDMRYSEAMPLVRATSGAEAIMVNGRGITLRSDGFAALEDKKNAAEQLAPRQPSQFPAGYKLSVALETVQTERKPYVFAWVVDSAGNYVKTLAAFGNEERYWHDMRQWWKLAQDDEAIQRVTHATQRAGKYPLAWDGTDQKGNGVPLGKYTIWVEVAAEHGPYAARFAAIELGKEPARVTIGASAAFKDVVISYGPKAGR
jgi:thiamine biosynthesis lipoprotein